MSYRAYCGPRGSDVPVALEKGQALYKEFESLDEALHHPQYAQYGKPAA
jgi:hypothetical protein